MNRRFIVFFLIFAFLLTSGFGCKITSKEVQEAMKPITLNYWSVFNDSDNFGEIIEKYKALHPFITIKYRKLRYDEYEKALIEAFATDSGPDIFSIHNTWVVKYQSKNLITPLPPEITMAYPIIKGSIKKEIVPVLKNEKSITLKEVNSNFIDAVYGDAVVSVYDEETETSSEKIYGLPLAVDTLALYYNRDLFNNAGISGPPEYWNREFQQYVKKLTRQDSKGNIIQSGVAMGGGSNIERSSDILSVLMMQSGAEMMDERGGVKFSAKPDAFREKNFNPGLDALRFYTDFSNPAKEVYCWNANLEDSLQLFAQNKLAMMFGYSYMLPQIKALSPKLNMSVTKLPQIEGNTQQVNFANYWLESVSAKSKYINEAWDFVQFATKAEQAQSYLAKTQRPSALRSLLAEQFDDPNIGVFAEQALTARSWYHGEDAIAAETIIEEMIDSVSTGEYPLEEAIRLGAQKVQQTVKKN